MQIIVSIGSLGMRVIIKVFKYTTSLAAIFILLLAALSVCKYIVAPTMPPSESLLSGDTLRVPKTINERSAQEFLKILREHSDEIKKIEAKGLGGDEDAAKTIAIAIRSSGLKPVVSDGAACVSACVGVLVESGSWEVSDRGFILFHEGATRAPTDASGCPACRAVATLTDAFVTPLTPETTRSKMQVWANVISPSLNDFFNSCTINPLSTYQGMAISGAQLKAIVAGTAPACDRISNQTFDWLQQPH
ncbi:hypothetical protein [Rhizobium sp. BT-226]|uniref:hypothetical protein n=1 Tax=Rhizobium sp. BT-226 TaxID=2986922 RepID=UPI0021F72286|nr:hypothetical protein [Rhizobium sp. BT-226]MCW0021393.1 hypothetical protein [Rhizobium sp. BT-226]